MYQYILFDLDGTLTDSREGITKSVQYALDKMGIHEPELNRWNALSVLRCTMSSAAVMDLTTRRPSRPLRFTVSGSVW